MSGPRTPGPKRPGSTRPSALLRPWRGLEDRLEDLEDYYIAKRELEAIRAGTSTTTPISDVMKRYGIDN